MTKIKLLNSSFARKVSVFNRKMHLYLINKMRILPKTTNDVCFATYTIHYSYYKFQLPCPFCGILLVDTIQNELLIHINNQKIVERFKLSVEKNVLHGNISWVYKKAYRQLKLCIRAMRLECLLYNIASSFLYANVLIMRNR